MVDGACSSVDRMNVTPKPAITTFFITKNQSKTFTIGLQYQSESCCEQEEPSQTSPSPSFLIQSVHNHERMKF